MCVTVFAFFTYLLTRTDAARAARRARSAGPAETEIHGLLSHGSC